MTDTDVAAPTSGSIFANRQFAWLFSATAMSMLGTQIGVVAIPLVAVLALDAGPGQVGVLGTLSMVAFLVIGLPAGAWMDRIRRRRVMMAADFSRAVLIGSVPVAWALHALTLPQLFVVVLCNGVATVFFDVSAQSYLPSVVPRERLVDANSRISGLEAANTVAGPGGAGYLIQLTTAPLATAVTAVGYLGSATLLSRIKHREVPPKAEKTESHLVAEVREGLEVVFRHPILRAIAIQAVATNLSVQIAITMLPVMFERVLKLPAGMLGLFFAIDGIGVLLGAATARRVTARLGEGRGLWIIGLAVVPACLAFPLVDHGAIMWVAAAAWLVTNYRIGVNNVILISFRQQITPTRLLGRVNATMRFMMTGVLAIGAGAAGAIGEFASVRTALWVAGVGLALVWMPLFFSPMRTMRTLPTDQMAE